MSASGTRIFAHHVALLHCEQTFHRWKKEFGMLEANQAKRLKDLEKENGRLKRIVADQMLGMELLQEALEKNCKPGASTAGGRAFC